MAVAKPFPQVSSTHYGAWLSSLVDSWKNRSKSEESIKIGTLALFDTLFHIKTGHKLCEALYGVFL